MNTLTLAYWGHGGPGPWILLFPLLWAAVVVGGVVLLRRTVWRRGGGPRRGGPPWQGPGPGGNGESAAALLARRFAAGEIDEDEYWLRLSVLKESRSGPA
ncbi:hypothetical protein N566_14840 [Streptomycetaceae bacterium MP113-05]|nr:hypothetical protein N566_14840 [Streptomycetaceae bacterium MP113-05]